MKNKLYRIFVFILYILSLFILLFCSKVRLDKTIYIYTKVRLILLFLVCLFVYIAGFILVKKLNNNKRILKLNLIIYFMIYTVTILMLTLFDEIYGRRGLVLVNWNKELLDTYIKYSFNIIPFRTITLFVSGYLAGSISLKNFIFNVFGNLVVLMPYGIFIPLMFKRINKYYKFFIIMLLLVILIEVLQFITISGCCDIDDVILNILGTSIVYFVYKIRFVKKLVNKIFLLE